VVQRNLRWLVSDSVIYECGRNRTLDLKSCSERDVETVYVCGINMEGKWARRFANNHSKHGWPAFLEAIVDGVPTDKGNFGFRSISEAERAINATNFSEHAWQVLKQMPAARSPIERGIILQKFLVTHAATERVHVRVARVLVFLLGRYSTTLPALQHNAIPSNCSRKELGFALEQLLSKLHADFSTFATAIEEQGNLLAATSLRWLILAAVQAGVTHDLWTSWLIRVFRLTCAGDGGSEVARTWIEDLRDAMRARSNKQSPAEQRTVAEEAHSWLQKLDSSLSDCSEEATKSLFRFVMQYCVHTPSQVLVVYVAALRCKALSRPDKLFPPESVANSMHKLMFTAKFHQLDPYPVAPPKDTVVESWFSILAEIPDAGHRREIGKPLVSWMRKAAHVHRWPTADTALRVAQSTLPDLFEALSWLEELASNGTANIRALFLPQLREVLMQENPNPRTTVHVRLPCASYCSRATMAHTVISQKLRNTCVKWFNTEIAAVRNRPNSIPLLVNTFNRLAQAIHPMQQHARGALWHPTMAGDARKILKSLVTTCAKVASGACDEIVDTRPTLQSLRSVARKTGEQVHDATHEMCRKFLQLFLEQHVTTTQECLAAFNCLAEGNTARPLQQNVLLSIAISHTAALVFEAPAWALDLDASIDHQQGAAGAPERKVNEAPVNEAVQGDDFDRTVTLVRLLTDYQIWSRFLSKTCTHQGVVNDISFTQCKPLVTAFKLTKHLATAMEGLNVTLQDVAELRKRWLAVRALCKPIHGTVAVSIFDPVTRWWQKWTQLRTFLDDWCLRAKACDVDTQV